MDKFGNDIEREAAVVIAIQKIGIADIEEIKLKIEDMGGKMTRLQIEKSAKNLQSRGILSVDMTERKDGITTIRYKVKKISYSVPEVPQIKNFLDSKEADGLIKELEKTKKSRKRSLVTDYYKVNIELTVTDKILGFVPNSDGKLVHYRIGKDIVLYPRHFRKWLIHNMRLINKFPTAAERIQTNMGYVALNGKPLGVEEFYITAVDNTYKSAGRGSKVHEVIPEGATIKTFFCIPSDDFPPEVFKKALQLFCETPIRGLTAYSKSGFGHLKLTKFENLGFIWNE